MRLRLHRDTVEHVSSVEFADTANIKVKVTVDAETAEIEIIEVMNDMNDEMVTIKIILLTHDYQYSQVSFYVYNTWVE